MSDRSPPSVELAGHSSLRQELARSSVGTCRQHLRTAFKDPAELKRMLEGCHLPRIVVFGTGASASSLADNLRHER